MAVRDVSYIFVGKATVEAVQDHFGRILRCWSTPLKIGEIVASHVTDHDPETGLTFTSGEKSIIHFRVLKAATKQEARSILARHPHKNRRLASGYWYEVHSD